MNREIKFRFWDKKYNCFSSDDLYLNDEGSVFRLSEVDYRGCCLVYMPDILPIRYTGIKDKNGKEIYEGDIINKYNKLYTVEFGTYSDGTGCQGEVSIYATGFYLKLIGKTSWDPLEHMSSNVEVIGNIYENSELLDE